MSIQSVKPVLPQAFDFTPNDKERARDRWERRKGGKNHKVKKADAKGKA